MACGMCVLVTSSHHPLPPERWVQTACPEIMHHDRNLQIQVFTACCTSVCTSLPRPLPQSSLEEEGIPGRPPMQLLVGVVLIAPATARQATPCNLQRSNLLTLYQTPGHQIVKRQVNNHGVNPMHYSGFQTPSNTKCVLTGTKYPVGNIHHVIQLCLPCQSLVRNKSKVFDLAKTLR